LTEFRDVLSNIWVLDHTNMMLEYRSSTDSKHMGS